MNNDERKLWMAGMNMKAALFATTMTIGVPLIACLLGLAGLLLEPYLGYIAGVVLFSLGWWYLYDAYRSRQ